MSYDFYFKLDKLLKFNSLDNKSLIVFDVIRMDLHKVYGEKIPENEEAGHPRKYRNLVSFTDKLKEFKIDFIYLKYHRNSCNMALGYAYDVYIGGEDWNRYMQHKKVWSEFKNAILIKEEGW